MGNLEPLFSQLHIQVTWGALGSPDAQAPPTPVISGPQGDSLAAACLNSQGIPMGS